MTTGTFAGDAALPPVENEPRELFGKQAGVPRLPVRLHLARDLAQATICSGKWTILYVPTHYRTKNILSTSRRRQNG